MKKMRLTTGELRLWTEWKSKPNALLTHLNFQYRLDNAVDIKRLNFALSTAVSIFDAFRLHFIEEEGVPYRIVLPAREVQVDFIDLTQDTLTDSTILEKVANQRRIELIKKPFDLRKTSLFRCALIKFSSESYYFVFVMPRILGDAYSLHLFLNLLSCVYNNGEEEKLKIMRQYQRRLREQPNDTQTRGISEALEAESYWKTKFDTASCQVAFNTAKKLTAKQKNKRIEIRLPVKLIVKLKNLASARDTTLFTILAAAICIFLFRYFEQDDISLFYPANVRTGEYANQLFGFFVNELGLRVQLSGELSFYEVLTNIIQQRVMDRSYQHYPLIEMLLAKLSVDNPRLSFPFNVGIAPTYFLENRLVLQGVNVQPVSFFSPEHSLNDLLFLYEDISTDTQLKLAVDYNTATFNTHFMKQMISHLRRLLEGIVANPEERINKILLLSERERYQLLVKWNKTEKEYPTNKTIPELFEAQVLSSPDAIALVFEEETLSYREVNERANQLGHYLRHRGVGVETLVAICIERSFNMVIGLMGILKAGGAYVPLDPEYPRERLQFMLEDTQARVLLTHSNLHSQFSGWYTGHMIAMDDLALGLEEQPKDNLHQLTFPENLAYVIYTSGSTGKPKGVMIEQRGVINLVCSLIEKREISADDCLLQFARLIFDASVAEILVTLLSGASLCLISKTIKLIGGELVQVLKKKSISAAILTPSALETIPLETSLPALRLLILAGEASSLVTVEKWSQRYQIINEYGPTETSVCATLGKVDLSRRKLSIGKPIANTKVYVLDQVQNPVPLGVIGELYIAGAGVARGYLRRPELTKERFIENPFASEEDKREGKNLRLYRSGDLVRYLADGNIEYIGRMDHQVKLRGYRIELGEIEALLRAQEAIVREAVVIVREDSPGQKRLVAYLVLQDKSEAKEAEHIRYLRQCIERQLPEYMVPGAFRVLERMPLTVTGKLDRRGLPVPDKHYRIEEYIAPRTKIEQALATIWSGLLGVEKIGVHDNFFSLGGDSLLATQLNSRLRQCYEIEIPLRYLFEHPTLQSLAEILTSEQATITLPAPSFQLVKREEVLPLSFAQQRLWFLDQFNENKSVYTIPFALRLTGKLYSVSLREAFDKLIMRHEILRTVFKLREGQAEQIILPTRKFDLEEIDLSTLSQEIKEERIKELMEMQTTKPFDLVKGPLIRGQLLCVDPEVHILLVTMHHIVSDGWSLKIFNQELSIFYNACKNKQFASLGKLAIQYADFTLWQRNWLSGEVLEKQLAYWKTQLENMPVILALPVDKTRPAVSSYRGAIYSFKLAAELTKQLRLLSKESYATLFMVVLAAFQVLLYRMSGQEDLAVGTAIANRHYQEIEGLIGFFVNTLVLRASCQGSPSFIQFLAQVRETTLGAYSQQDVPFEQLVEHLKVERRLNYHPLFQVMFVFQEARVGKLELNGLRSELIEVELEIAQFDLTLIANEMVEELSLSFEYATDLFEAQTIERMALHLTQLLKGIVSNPEERIDKIPLLSERERNQLLVTWNKTEKEYPTNKTIPEIFEAQVASSPDAIALRFEDESLSYREVNERANQLAHYLRSLGIGAETLVAICLERSLDMVIGVIGILKAGAVYVPLDPDYPSERLQFIVEDTKAAILLTHSNLHSQFSGWYTGHTIAIDDPPLGLEKKSKANLPHLISLGNLAYVIYTSGSTGKPKGVMIEQRGVINLVCSLIEKWGVSSEDRILQFANLIFDASVAEILTALLSGARLCLVPKAKLIGEKLLQILERERISILTLTPSVLETVPLVASLSALRLISLGGEAPLLETVEKWSQHYQLINWYGPTETSVCATLGKVDLSRRKLSIGKPIANTKVYVLDQVQNPVPLGVIGELYIAGAGVARGYLRRPELTKERFIENPFASEEDKREGKNLRLYRSGDLVRYLADGNIEYIGRMDHQVKLRGYRIELGEIEALLRAQEAIVREAVVIVREDSPGQKRLVAYLVLQDKSEAKEAEHIRYLRQCIERQLPEYMVPGAFRVLERMPLTVTGKLDRRGLPVPDKHYRIEEYIAPRTKIEQALATIWSGLLGVEKIGVHDNFFSLGGHSLLVVQMLALVSKKVGRDFSISQFMGLPTIEMLSAQIENEAYGKKANHELIERLKKDSVLDETIRPLSHMNPYLYNPKCVLLTGATGFLGAHVLYELLEKTQVIIYCLIRSSSIETALQSIMQKSLKYCLPIQKYADRIIPILGDLSKQKLGLSNHDFDILTKELDSIYHVGAWVHHLFDYDTLYKVNVQSTYEILRIATSTKNKAVHFISTLGTNYISPIVQLSSMDKDSEQVQLNFNGYLMSKWVSEQLLLEAATCRGIAAHVYRPGNIIAGVLHGISEPDSNHILLRLKGLLQLKKGYIDRREMFEMIPVDLLATALINISHKPKRFSFNLNNNKEVPWISYIMVAKAFGYHFDLIEDAQEWNHILENLDKENALYKLTYFYKINVSNLQPEREQSQSIIPDYFISTPSYKEMMEKQLYSLIKSGFFPKPAK